MTYTLRRHRQRRKANRRVYLQLISNAQGWRKGSRVNAVASGCLSGATSSNFSAQWHVFDGICNFLPYTRRCYSRENNTSTQTDRTFCFWTNCSDSSTKQMYFANPDTNTRCKEHKKDLFRPTKVVHNRRNGASLDARLLQTRHILSLRKCWHWCKLHCHIF